MAKIDNCFCLPCWNHGFLLTMGYYAATMRVLVCLSLLRGYNRPDLHKFRRGKTTSLRGRKRRRKKTSGCLMSIGRSRKYVLGLVRMKSMRARPDEHLQGPAGRVLLGRAAWGGSVLVETSFAGGTHYGTEISPIGPAGRAWLLHVSRNESAPSAEPQPGATSPQAHVAMN